MDVGPGVSNLKPGDDVAIEPAIPCWSSRAARFGLVVLVKGLSAAPGFIAVLRELFLMVCYREGRYNIDPDIKCFATPPVHGSLAEVRTLTRDVLLPVCAGLVPHAWQLTRLIPPSLCILNRHACSL